MATPSTELRPARWLAFLLNMVAGVTLLALMVITCIDVFGRYILRKPLTGSTELIEIGLGIVIFAVLPIVCWRNENVVVDILDSRFSAAAHWIKNSLINLVSALALFYIGKRLMVLAARSLEYGEFSEFLHIPTGWSIYFMGGMCWFTAAALLSLGMLHAYSTYRNVAKL